MTNSFLRLPAVMNATGLSRASVYLRIKQGLMPAPVKLGERAVAWPASEISAINAARIAGKTTDEIRTIVANLERQRASMA
jgi:Predicted transcriptional regulator